jgi:cytochrome d ubiquinol oxidase subunit II
MRARALGTGLIAGALALGGLIVLHGDAHHLYTELTSGSALAALIVSALAGLATLALVAAGRFEAARYTAALAVAAVLAGWALGQWPTVLPGLDIRQAAAPHDVLVAVVVAVLGGGAIVFPSLAVLFRLALAGRLGAGGTEAESFSASPHAGEPRTALLGRLAVACLIVGLGFLTAAEARWAHIIGVLAIVGFILAAFLALVPGLLAYEP